LSIWPIAEKFRDPPEDDLLGVEHLAQLDGARLVSALRELEVQFLGNGLHLVSLHEDEFSLPG
jgi:hypothetical protein